MSHVKLHVVFSLIGLHSATSSADQIILMNGDIIQGTRTEITDTHIIWNADNFGTLSIALNQVVSISPTAQEPEDLISEISSASPDESLEGRIGVSGLLRGGNEDREEWDVSADLAWRHENIRHRGDIHYQTRREEGEQPEENYDLSYAFEWFFKDGWYWSNAASFGANDNRGIEQFYSVGSLLGNQLWETDAGALSIKSGFTWISETFVISTRDQRFMRDKKDERLTWNWSTDYRKIIFEHIELFHTNELLISVEDADNSQFNAGIGFDVPLVDDLFTKFALKWNYDNQPTEGIEKIDRSFSIGVNYSW